VYVEETFFFGSSEGTNCI